MTTARAGSATSLGKDDVAETVVERARASYGRLIALLSARDGDIAASEDALSEAFAAALRAWPRTGIPANPDAWLLTTARNQLRNAYRHETVKLKAIDEILIRMDASDAKPATIPDMRLALMFVCAHPAIQEDMRTPLMLQTILGLDAGQIGSAFLVSPTTMGQRLVRAKAKIKLAGIGFALPDRDVMAERLDDVLSAIYAAFGTVWDGVDGDGGGQPSLAGEAIFLARLIVSLLPGEPEALGLLALMLYIEARRPARAGPDGAFIPLREQDARLWRRDLILEAEAILTHAGALGRVGRFQLEAAIQSVHVQTPVTGSVNWAALRSLHELLLQHRPSIGAFVSYAAVLLGMGLVEAAREVLDSLEPSDVAHYQPYWVTRHAVLAATQDGEAEAALKRAVSLTRSASVCAYLLAQARRDRPGPP